MLESIFDDSLITNDEDIEMLDISDPTPVLQPTEVLEQPKIEPIDKKVQEVKQEVVQTEKDKDNIFTIQIALIIAWAVLTAIVYFFGYPLFEPFIGV